MKKRDLYLGISASNHVPRNEREGEVILMAASWLPGHANFNCFPCERDLKDARRTFSRRGASIDYRFALAIGKEFMKTYSNLHTVGPKIIDQYLLDISRYGETVDDLKIYLGGELREEDRFALASRYEKRFPKLVIEACKKQEKEIKAKTNADPPKEGEIIILPAQTIIEYRHCPYLVHVASSWANLFSSWSFERLMAKKRNKFVDISNIF